MLIKDILGKTITNIYLISGIEQEWLDTADCLIELDNALLIGIPSGHSNEVWEREPDPAARSLFINLADIPSYHVNKEGKSIKEVADAYQKRKNSFLGKIKKALFGEEKLPKEYRPYKVEYRENKLKYIQQAKIADFLWYDEAGESGFFVLDNGYIITEKTMAPSGTGQAGLHYFESLESLEKAKGNDYKRLNFL